MKVRDIFPDLSLSRKTGDLKIKDMSDDSRCVAKGDLFFIRKRKNFDIFSVLGDVEGKASVFAADIKDKRRILSKIKKKPVIFIKGIYKAFFRAADIFYGFNKEDFIFIGITGTNGKTTTAYLIYDILKKSGKKACLIGTVNYIIDDKTYRADFTTPGFLDLRKIFKKAKARGCQFVVMEVSSHGLDQRRVAGIRFSRCIFTNLSRDHLDYHRTMQNYFNAKKRLFKSADGSLAIINNDDPYGRKLLKTAGDSLSYGINHKSDFMAADIRLARGGMEFNVICDGESLRTKTSIFGKHNILNILAALATLSSLGFKMSKLIKFIRSFKGAEGRLQMVEPDVFIDYAHTPDALKNTITTLKDVGYKNVICVFGCGGQRDKGKRRIMGSIASKCADYSFITADNPRLEPIEGICRDIEQGFTKQNCLVVPERKEAIKAAMLLKFLSGRKEQKESCILVAGKGHEDYQIIGTKKFPFKDADVVKELMKKLRRSW